MICWTLGLSHRNVSRILSGLQVALSHMSVWRDAQEQAERIRQHNRWRKVRALGEVQELIEFLPPQGDKRLYALWKQLAVGRAGRGRALSALEELRDLLVRLSQRWTSFCTFQGEPQVPWTTNATEHGIGRMKMRARTVRGYKSWGGMQTGLLLIGAHWF